MEENPEIELLKIKVSAYRKLIERYAEAINAGEQKTIPELKLLVAPNDEAIQKTRNQILSELGLAEGYRFEKDFLAAAEKAYNFVQAFKRIHQDMPVSFWLKPAEILELGAADAFDRAIFLCSLLHCLGCTNSKIRVLELEGGLKHPAAVFSYNEKQYLMDAMQECSAFTYHGALEEVLKNYTFEGRKFLKSSYEFNNEEYVELD